jgi:TetR/AcrR family transcriptional regulator, transcriptional repressor for nem operon
MMDTQMPIDTKQFILDTAETLILTRGYNGFSYKDIADVVGIRKASIHHHFPSKEDLGTAFVARYFDRLEQWQKTVAPLSVSLKLASFLKMYQHVSDNAEKICPLGMLTAEYPTLPQSMQENLRHLLGELDQWLVQVVAQGQAEGYLRPVPEATILAKVIINAMSASLKMARVFHDIDQLGQVFDALMALIRIPGKSATPAQ